MQKYIPFGVDQDILDEIGRWKVLPLRALYESLNQPMHYSALCKRVQKLERTGMLKGFTGQKTKYLILTAKGCAISKFNNHYEASEDSLTHDLIASLVLRRLLQFENFKSGFIFNDEASEVEPDGIIHAVDHDKEYILAVEVELTQKKRTRVAIKFSKYMDHPTFNHVLYIFNKKAVFEAYKNILTEMDEYAQEIIVLCHDPGLSAQNFNYLESQCWHRDAPKTFEQIFKSQNGGGE